MMEAFKNSNDLLDKEQQCIYDLEWHVVIDQ